MLGWLALLVSFGISAIAIYFSVTGWVALFPTAIIGVTLMFGSIEVGKLVAAGFLHWHWQELPFLLKSSLSMMVVVAMLITSVGVYGFLSKGHLDQSLPADGAVLQLELLDTRVGIEKSNIERANERIISNNERLDGLQSIVDTLIDFDRINDNRNGKGALTIEAEQQPERGVIRANIDAAQDSIEASAIRIGELEVSRLEFNQQVNAVEAKLGPMQYVADILNFTSQDAAVQLVILVVMLVFDPFAVALLLAGLWAIKHRNDGKIIAPKKKSVTELKEASKEEIEIPKPKIELNMADILKEIKTVAELDNIEATLKQDDSVLAESLRTSFDEKRNELKASQGWIG